MLFLVSLDALSWILFASEGGFGHVERPSLVPNPAQTSSGGTMPCAKIVGQKNGFVPMEFDIAQQGN